MKNKTILFTAFLLIVAIGNYTMFITNENTRIVESLSSFAIGVLSGILILQISKVIKERKKD
jgi:hypothetical protein